MITLLNYDMGKHILTSRGT